MTERELANDLRVALDATLEELVGDSERVLPGPTADRWQIRSEDLEFLRRFGLPSAREDGLLGVVGAFAEESAPVSVGSGTGRYRVGMFGRARLIIADADGAVWAVPSSKPEDIHPQLRSIYPDGIRPQFANSNVAALVEIAWRWNRLVGVLSRMAREAAMETHRMRMEGNSGAITGPDSPSARVGGQREILLKSLGRIDPRAVEDGTLWNDAVMDH